MGSKPRTNVSGRWLWPNAPRPNPSGALSYSLKPHWIPLRRQGAWNVGVRDAVHGKSGVYALRETSNPGTVLYVGESHAASTPIRMWKTIVRHFQDTSGRFEAVGEWSHRRETDLDVALWITPPSHAFELEGELIAELDPLHASGRPSFERGADELDDVPF